MLLSGRNRDNEMNPHKISSGPNYQPDKAKGKADNIRFRREEGDMKLECVSCGHELNLDHGVFDDYEGPVKCFSCCRMMEVKTARGIVYSINPSPISGIKNNLVLLETRD